MSEMQFLPAFCGSVGPVEDDADAPRLRPHQVEAVGWLAARPKAVLADEVGLGKTATAAVLLTRLSADGQLAAAGRHRLARVLWLTDASLIEQTAAELAKFAPRLSVMGTGPEMASGAKGHRAREQNFPNGADVLVMSYELAHSRRNWLDSYQFAALVCDEASKLRGKKAFHKTVRQLATRTGRVIGMTATLMENDPTELWAVLHALDIPMPWTETAFNEGFVHWKVAHVDQWGREHYKADGWSDPWHARDVREYLPNVVMRREPADVGLRLPRPVGGGPRWVPLTAKQAAAYQQATKVANIARGFHGQQQAGIATAGESALIDTLMAELRDRDPEQAIVYSEYLEVLDLIASALEAEGVDFERIDGKVTGAQRERTIEAFRTGEVRVLLGNIVLERGLNLQNARLLISLDSSWNPARERQREGRICRIGSEHETYEHIVLLPDTPLVRNKVRDLTRKHEAAQAVGL